jgi:hypothetical protein
MTDQPGVNQPQLNLPDPGQPGPQLVLMLEPDLKGMHLRIGQNGKLIAGIVMSANHLESLIENMIQVRAKMLPPPVEAAPVEPALVEAAPAQEVSAPPVQVEPAPIEFSPDAAREIKGTHYDFGLSDNGQQLIFSVRDEDLGWLSFRFGARLLERMLRVVNAAKKPK